MSWTTFKPWLLMASIFGVGMVAGGALVIAFHPEPPHNPPGVQQLRSHWLSHLSHRLNLTPDQQARVEPIINDAVNRIQSLHQGEIEQIGRIMDSTNEKLAPILTAEQQATLKEMMRERQRDFSGHMHPWNGPPHGPGPGLEPAVGPGDGFPPGPRPSQQIPPPNS